MNKTQKMNVMIFKKLNTKIREMEISRKEKQIKKETTKYENWSLLEKNIHRKSTYSKILAREILITEAFINRISRETKRPIVVIGNGRTGKPYTWSIKNDPKKNIFIENFNYPSTDQGSAGMAAIQLKLFKFVTQIRKKIHNQKLEKPIFLFVDASRNNRMPSSFTGYNLRSGYVSKENSMYNLFRNEKVKLVGYDWSMHDNTKYLPKITPKLNESDIILFNPVGKGEQTNRYSAYHDDREEYQSKPYKNYVLKRVDILKHNLFEK